MEIENIKNLYAKSQEEIDQRTIELYKWIQQKNTCQEPLTYEEQLLIEEKTEDLEFSSMKIDTKEE
ncbi:22680_t:CDS:2, partial [Dentiscutata erythropus]